MKLLPVIASLAKSLHLYLQMKNEMFFSELRRQSQERQHQYINEIEKLRDIGDSNSSDRADILRQKLAAERQEFEHLSTFYNKAKTECANSDS
jgi:hypothetical protein